tara:strand:+ start:1844 stop:2227 length:384 start_codon:yes stop_codon:yes gene_type:complete
MRDKLLKISELSKKLDLIKPSNKKPLNHILRYWENEFKQIKPKIINGQRYYDSKQVELFKLIKFLLKTKGISIKGVKKILNNNVKKLDANNSHSLKADYLKIVLKEKAIKVANRIKKLKQYGKKNSH